MSQSDDNVQKSNDSMLPLDTDTNGTSIKCVSNSQPNVINSKTDTFNSNWVKLNVGGKYFVTSRSTLSRYPTSFLAVLCQEDSKLKSDKDEDGAFLIDRDPACFASILNFLRHGKLILTKDITEEGIIEEAEFYNLPELVQLCKSRINRRTVETEKVYRVFTLSEYEIPTFISHISDDWKIKQIIYYRNSDNYPMFLCVTYKEFLKREHSEFCRSFSPIDNRFQKLDLNNS